LEIMQTEGIWWATVASLHARTKGSSPATLPKFKPFPSIELL
jgi:hypothetical protein